MAKKLIKLETGKDIISCLPEYIICKILGSLSIGDAIRTSFLSRDWRYKWRKIPDLIFDGQSFSNEQVNPSLIRRNYLRKVNQTLFLHRGNIVRRFEFSSRWEVVSSKVDKWMDHLKVISSVQELKLEFGTEYLVPCFVLQFDNLTTLDLTTCKIILPTSFNGLKNLTTLNLHSITFDQENALDTMVNLCPFLNDLDIQFLLGCPQRLVLRATNIKSLTIFGSLSYFEFKENRMVPLLKYATLALDPKETIYDFSNILSNLINVNVLELWGCDYENSMVI